MTHKHMNDFITWIELLDTSVPFKRCVSRDCGQEFWSLKREQVVSILENMVSEYKNRLTMEVRGYHFSVAHGMIAATTFLLA